MKYSRVLQPASGAWPSQNGFYHGRDARPTGKTGWVPIANISSMRVCPS